MSAHVLPLSPFMNSAAPIVWWIAPAFLSGFRHIAAAKQAGRVAGSEAAAAMCGKMILSSLVIVSPVRSAA